MIPQISFEFSVPGDPGEYAYDTFKEFLYIRQAKTKRWVELCGIQEVHLFRDQYPSVWEPIGKALMDKLDSLSVKHPVEIY